MYICIYLYGHDVYIYIYIYISYIHILRVFRDPLFGDPLSVSIFDVCFVYLKLFLSFLERAPAEGVPNESYGSYTLYIPTYAFVV